MFQGKILPNKQNQKPFSPKISYINKLKLKRPVYKYKITQFKQKIARLMINQRKY